MKSSFLPSLFYAHFQRRIETRPSSQRACVATGISMPVGAFVIALFCAAMPAQAHEFWLWPDAYEVQPGETASATIRVGEHFKGNAYSYNPRDFERFEAIEAGELESVSGQLGDRPAMQVPDAADGLLVGVHQSGLSRLTYSEFDKFKAFARLEGEDGVIQEHMERDLPERGFEEVYRRFAKTYIKVGEGEGADRPVGMAFELVALSNPYTDAGNMKFQLLRDGEPDPDAQVAVWSRPLGETTDGGAPAKGERVLYRTDASGQVSVDTAPGREYLASAVRILEPGPAELEERPDAVWYSVWASATWLAQQ